jgi:cold shock CspA family protein
MGRSQETQNKKEVRNKKEKKRKDKAEKKLARKDNEKRSMDDMIAYVDENGMITSTPPDPSKKRKVALESITVGIPKQDKSQKPDPIRKGVVTFFNESKGFGFIKDSETGQSVFVHVRNLLEEIKENNMVSFEVEMGLKGLTAVKVKLFK